MYVYVYGLSKVYDEKISVGLVSKLHASLIALHSRNHHNHTRDIITSSNTQRPSHNQTLTNTGCRTQVTVTSPTSRTSTPYVLLSVERRVNFCAYTLTAGAHTYQSFLSLLVCIYIYKDWMSAHVYYIYISLRELQTCMYVYMYVYPGDQWTARSGDI